jgi:hypothetical protein
VPLHKIKSCDGIFNGGVTDVGSTRLDSPPKVLFDPTKSGSGYVSHESGSIGEKEHTNLAVPVCTALQQGAGTR